MGNNVLTSTHFFMETATHAELVERFGRDDISFNNGMNFCFDIIDQPFHCAVQGEEGSVTVSLYVRSEIGILNPDLSVKIFSNGEKPEILANSGRLGQAGEALTVFLKVASTLEHYAVEQGLCEELSDIDTDAEGFLVEISGEEVSFKRVSGKKRPAMACTTLLGGVEMKRPYSDEIFEHWGNEMLSLEEKIEAAEDGDETLMEELANLYLNGDEDEDVAPDAEKAVYWFTKLAERDDCDNSNVQFNLGLLFAKGHGTERDFAKAAYWMRRAEENGDTDAPELIETFEKMAAAVDKAAAGDAQAQADLAAGLMKLGGSLDQAGPGKDYEEAFVLAQKAAEQNNGDGLWTLALAYEHGRGVRKNTKRAVECYRKGAELGHAPSQHSLACYHMRGEVVEQDETLAVDLMMKSAEQGYNLAEFGLAHAYERGIGVEDDLDKAIEWGEKAAEHGTPDIWYEVAKLYMNETGEGMIDAERARHWLSKAADAGHEMAFSMLNFAPIWGEDGDDMGEDEDADGENEEYANMVSLVMEAMDYEEELYEQGLLPDEPHGDDALETLPRVHLKAAEGDEKAQRLLDAVDEISFLN